MAFAHYNVKTLKLGNIRRHEKTRAHKNAMIAAGQLPADSLENKDDAPSVETILQFWQNRRTGSSLTVAVPGFSSENSMRNRKLEWCIAEARRCIFRTFIESSNCSATLMQDGRGKHLLVRAVACNEKLDVATATLSLVLTQGGATNLCVATLKALEDFCTPGLGRPHNKAHPDVPASVLNKVLLKKLSTAFRWWFTDAAYDEFAAGELLFSVPEARGLFPNLRVVGREKAHASRRVLSRPQSTDPYLTEVCNRFIWNYDSVASIIQHNPTVNDIFCVNTRDNPAASQIEKLRFRRHRFDSQAEPMTRIVLAFDAILQTLAAVSHGRKTEDIGKNSATFLQWVDDEACLQLGMMADASDQVMLLVRSNDQDHPDPATMSAYVHSFLIEGARLWLEEHCWGFGCTASMLRFLRHPRTYLIAGGQKGICEVGGHVDEACKKRCLGRMVCWFRVAIDVCHAEWPYYDIVNALNVFAVNTADSMISGQDRRGLSAERLQSQNLERLANTFGCQPDVLEAQYTTHRPLAQAAYLAAPCTNLKAWSDAVSRTERPHLKGLARWKSDVLRTMLMHYGACCASTSALERRFSKLEKIWGTRIDNQSCMHMRDTLELLEPFSDADREKIAEIVREVWRIYYPGGCSRPNATVRIDKGIKRERGADNSFATFNRDRHRASLKSFPGVSSVREIEEVADRQIQAAGSWTPAMQKEHEFQMKKVVRGIGETCQSGGALSSEVALFRDVAAEHKAKRANAIHQRWLSDSRKLSRIVPTKPMDFSIGGCVFITPGCLDAFEGDVATAVSQIIRKNDMRRVDDPIDAAAGYIIDASLKGAGRTNRWVAVLAGCALVTPDYFTSEGKSGGCLRWRAAVNIKRQIYISAELQRDEPLLAGLLRWAIQLPASKWTLRKYDSKTYVAKQRKQKTLIGAITPRQKGMRIFQAIPHAFAPDQFLDFVGKLEPSTSGQASKGSKPSTPHRPTPF